MNAYDDGYSPNEAPKMPGQKIRGDTGQTARHELDEIYFQEASINLATRAEDVEPRLLIDALERHYDFAGSVTALSSEVEHTAAATLADGRQFILKTSSQPVALESFHFQSSVIAGLETATGFVVPQILRTRRGSLMFEEPGICGYLQERLSGVSLQEVNSSPDVLFRMGRALAEMGKALKLSDAPGKHRPVLWNVKCWSRLGEFARYLPHGSVAKLVNAALQEFNERIERHLQDLVWQVTHNDPSPYNSFLTDRGIAFIDFGDGGWGPQIQDLAIASSHFVTDSDLALGGAEHLIAGYAAACPLTELEASILVGLMKARQSALILINCWRAELFPEDAAYIKKNVARAEKGLAFLSSLSPAMAEATVTAAVSGMRGCMKA